MLSSDRPKLELRLQGQGRVGAAGLERAGGALRSPGQRAPERRPRAHHGSVRRRHHRPPYVGGEIRRGPGGRLHASRRNHAPYRDDHRTRTGTGGAKTSGEEESQDPGRLGLYLRGVAYLYEVTSEANARARCSSGRSRSILPTAKRSPGRPTVITATFCSNARTIAALRSRSCSRPHGGPSHSTTDRRPPTRS